MGCYFMLQLSQRKEVCEHRATVARNDYVLNLGATNAHQRRFYGIDLPQLIKVSPRELWDTRRRNWSGQTNLIY